MIKINQLPRTTKRRKKRLGRGYGSGKGKTAGRGTKGQKSRGKIPLTLMEGGVSFVRRLPLFRGKYRNKPKSRKKLVINLKQLNQLPKNTIIDKDFIVKSHLLKQEDVDRYQIKILGDGEISIPLVVKFPVSKNARKKIEKALGRLEYK